VELTGPDTFEEGDVVAFSGAFTDAEWLDKHTASWDWGDPSPPESGALVETHNPPAASGTVHGSHAWGDAGTYLVTLTARDEDGAMGEASKEVIVRNVPPIVRTPDVACAYPCTVMTLQGAFTDKGWPDRHVGAWDFGEATCTALIHESNTPPIGRGTATASHVYREQGTYSAHGIVTDDDGANGRDETIVHVIDVRNRHFERGFRLRLVGEVANHWEPYIVPLHPIAPGQPPPPERPSAVPFSGQTILFHDGEYAQRIRPSAGQRAGLWQRIGANPGWEYQLTAWYSLAQRQDESGVTGFDPEDARTWARPDGALLGIDPSGGDNPTNPAIVWTRVRDRLEWRQLAAAATARGDAITIFLEASGGDLVDADACFDDVALIPVCRVIGPERDEQCRSEDEMQYYRR
jgi:PKD repeat protein